MSIDPTNPTTHTNDALERFATSMDLAAQADQAEMEKAERDRQIAEGRLLAFIDQSNFSIPQLTAIVDFVRNGCVIDTDDQLSEQLEAERQQTFALRQEIERLSRELQNAGTGFAILCSSQEDMENREAILGQFVLTDGSYMASNDVANLVQAATRQPAPTQQQPQTPPQQGQGQQPQQQRQQGNGNRNRQRNNQQGRQQSSQQSDTQKPSWAKRAGQFMLGTTPQHNP